MTSEPSVIALYPQELLSIICAYVDAFSQPPIAASLDPIIHTDNEDSPLPISFPSSYPAPTWPDATVRRTLASLCLTNRAWHDAAKPWLWRKVEVHLPRSWLALVEEIAGACGDEEAQEAQAVQIVDRTIQAAESAALAAKRMVGDVVDAQELHKRLLETLSGPDGSIPPELLTPPASREVSRQRPRQKSKSPARWKIVRSISVALQDVMEQENPGLYGKHCISSE